MALLLNPRVYPPDGYFFTETDGVKLIGDNFAKLILVVRDYRIRNGLPPGDPVKEVNDFTCKRYPSGCREMEPGMRKDHVGNSVPHPLSTRVNTWLSSLYRIASKNPLTFVLKTEAERRAAICFSCPKQASWASGCTSCAATANRLAFSLRKGQEASQGPLLSGCSVLGEDTRTSIFVANMRPAENAELPEGCWRK